METATPGDARVILLVDDVEQVVSIASEYLERKIPHVRIVTFTKPSDALAWLAKAPRVDLVLSDNHMGEMDGITLLGRVREMHPKAFRALMTAYLDIDATPAELAQRGLHALIRKPWEWPELARFLARVLGIPYEERARIETEGPVAFPASAFAEFAARREPQAKTAQQAADDEARRRAEREEEREPPRATKARRDLITFEMRVTCPECHHDFAVDTTDVAPPPAPAEKFGAPGSRATETGAPARHAHPHAPTAPGPQPALDDDEEARRILSYLQRRPGVANRMRALQSQVKRP